MFHCVETWSIQDDHVKRQLDVQCPWSVKCEVKRWEAHFSSLLHVYSEVAGSTSKHTQEDKGWYLKEKTMDLQISVQLDEQLMDHNGLHINMEYSFQIIVYDNGIGLKFNSFNFFVYF